MNLEKGHRSSRLSKQREKSNQFAQKHMLCVPIGIALRGDSNEYTQHTFVCGNNHLLPELTLFTGVSGVMGHPTSVTLYPCGCHRSFNWPKRTIFSKLSLVQTFTLMETYWFVITRCHPWRIPFSM